MNRGYLLPQGCKDLIDAWKLKGSAPWGAFKYLPSMTPEQWKAIGSGLMHKSLNFKFKGMLTVPAQVSVLELATMLNQNMSQILADLLKTAGFAAIKEQLDFTTVSKIAWKYGFIVRKAKE